MRADVIIVGPGPGGVNAAAPLVGAALAEAVRNERPDLIIVDLEGLGFDGVEALLALRDVPEAGGIPRLAYGSHVDAERLAAAAAAGATEVMPRSRFVRELRAWME